MMTLLQFLEKIEPTVKIKGLPDAVEALNSKEQETASDTHSGSIELMRSIYQAVDLPQCKQARESHPEKRRKKNRSGLIYGLTGIASAIEKHFENVSKQWDKVIECFALEKNKASKKAIFFEEIMKIPDLDQDVEFQAATILVDNPRKIICSLVFLMLSREG